MAGALASDSDTAVRAASNSNGLILSSSDEGLPAGSSARTVELWFNGVPQPSAVGYGSDFSIGLTPRQGGGADIGQILVSAGGTSVTIPTVYDFAGGWHLLDVSLGSVGGSSTAAVYLDGQLQGRASLTASTVLGAGLTLGQVSPCCEGNQFDELALYPSVLSAAAIDVHWAAGASPMATPCAAAPTSAYGKLILAANPSVYYRLDDVSTSRVAYDSSGHCANGAYPANIGSVPGAIATDSDPAIQQDSNANNVAMLASGQGLPAGSSPRTVEFWFRFPCCGSANAPVLSYGSDFSIAIAPSGSNSAEGKLTVSAGGSSATVSTLPGFDNRAWDLIDVTLGPVGGVSTASVFVNGQLQGSVSLTASTVLDGTGLTLGYGGCCESSEFDELAIFPTALTAATIDTHWTAGESPTATPCAATPTSAYGKLILAANPSVYYRLDDVSTSRVAYDSSGHCANGAYPANIGSVPGAIATDSDPAIQQDSNANNVAMLASGQGLPAGSSPRTVEFWYRFPGCCGTPNTQLLSYGSDFSITSERLSDRVQAIVVSAGGSSATFNTGPYVGDGPWHLLDVMLGSVGGTASASVFVDGHMQGSSLPLAASTVLTANGLTLGAVGCCEGSEFDEVAIYPTVLTPNQILGHEIAGAGQQSLIGGPYTGTQTYGGGSICIPCAIKAALHAMIGMPVDTATGDMYHSFSDISIPGRGLPLNFTRTYNSLTPSSTGPFGYGWTFSYNLSLNLDGQQNATISEENGSQTTFVNNSGTYSPAAPRDIATLVHNGDGTWTFTRQAQVVLTFNASGQLTEEKDLNGYATSLGYAGGQLSTITDPAGRTLSVGWTGGVITSLTDANVTPSRTVLYGYNDGAGNLTDVTDVAGGTEHFTYDSNHRMLTMRDPRGNAVTNAYDASTGRITSQSDQLNRQTIFAYGGDNSSAAGGTTTVTDPQGNVTMETYQYGLLVQRTKGSGTPQAATWFYRYDPATLGQTSVTDPNGHITTMTYDGQGNLLTSTDPLGRQTVNTYNSLRERLTTTDPKGVTTTMVYDSAGNLQSASRPLSSKQNQLTLYHYSDTAHPGDVTSMTDPRGFTWTYAYDRYGDRVSSADPLGDTTTSTFNGDGWKTTTVSPKGNVSGANPALYRTTSTYDAFGDVQTITDPLGHVTTRGYDADRNLTSLKDAKANVTKYTYDAANEQTIVTRPNGTTLGTTYNPDGTVFQQIDGKGNATTYGYDALARVISVTDPLGRVTKSTYDGAGNHLTTVDAQSQTTTYAYDASNQLTSIHYSDGVTPNVTNIQYDADGQRISMTDGTGTSTWAWDNLNRLIVSREAQGGAAVAIVKYGYDLKGQLTSLAYPGGSVVARTYDQVGRLMSVKDWLNNTTKFAYDPNSNLIGEALPSTTGVKDYFTYDVADRLVKTTDTKAGAVFASFAESRNADNLVVSDASTGMPAPTKDSYTYTTLDQLRTVNSGTYAYDAADNLTGLASGASLSYDAANELTQLAQGTTTTTYGYDARGNRTARTPSAGTAVSYTYDQANRLTAVGSAATYAYNGDGLRMKKTVSGVAEPFAWDVAEGLPLVIADSSTRYVTGPGGLALEQITGSAVLYYHHDQLGSTRVITDGGGGVTATYTFDAFGNRAGSTGTVSNPFGYAGQYADVESGLLYLRARYYEPSIAQFLTRDPIVSITRSSYEYVAGNPLNRTDPSGLCGLWGDDVCGWVSGAEQVATLGIVGSATALCIAATDGLCALALPFVGAATNTAVYAESDGPHTIMGYGSAFAEGGIGGSLGLACILTCALAGSLAIGGAVVNGLWGGAQGAWDYSQQKCDHSASGYAGSAAGGAVQGGMPWDSIWKTLRTLV